MTSASWQLSHSSFPLTTNLTFVTEQKCPNALYPGIWGDSCPPVHLKIDQTSVEAVDPRDSANPSHSHSPWEEKPRESGPEDTQGRRAGYQHRTEMSLYAEQRETWQSCPQPRGQCTDLSCVVVADNLSRGGHGKLEWGVAAQPPAMWLRSHFLSRSTWTSEEGLDLHNRGVRKRGGEQVRTSGAWRDAVPAVHCRTSTRGPPIPLKDCPLGPRAPQNHEPTPLLLPALCVSAWSAQKIGHSQSVDREGSTDLTNGPTSWKTKERFLAASLVNWRNQWSHKSFVKEVSATSNSGGEEFDDRWRMPKENIYCRADQMENKWLGKHKFKNNTARKADETKKANKSYWIPTRRANTWFNYCFRRGAVERAQSLKKSELLLFKEIIGQNLLNQW